MNISLGKNQYLLTERTVSCGYENKICVDKYSLYLGDRCQCFNYTNHIYVVGYTVDVVCPEKTLEDMCKELDGSLKNGVKGPQSTRNWNGRFVVIVVEYGNVTVWNDCCGLKQIFFDNTSPSTIASQARYIAELRDYEKDQDACEYLKIAKEKDKEYAMILSCTLYKEVNRLLPNHYISNGSIVRADLYREKGASDYAAELIRNSMTAIRKQGPLDITLTAGWDSRLVLSGVIEFDNSVAVTLQYDWMEETDQDIVIAGELAKVKGIRHRVTKCKNSDKLFIDDYMTHSENGHIYWAQMAQVVRDGDFSDSIWVKGSCNEIIRNSFGILYNWQVSEKILIYLYNLPECTFVKECIREWLREARPYCKKNAIRLLDLFYWEHRVGSWVSQSMNEFDVVADTFSPFNSRVYIENGLYVNVRHRIPPKYDYFKSIIGELNADLLSYPINTERYKTIGSRVYTKIKYNAPLAYGFIIKVRKLLRKQHGMKVMT